MSSRVVDVKPGFSTKGIVINLGEELKDDKSYDNKILVRVLEVHGPGALFDSLDPQGSSMSDDEISWSKVQVPADGLKDKTVYEYKTENFKVGDLVYVTFPSGRIVDISVTGVACPASESGIGEEDSGFLSRLMNNVVVRGLAGALGFSYADGVSKSLDDSVNYNPKFAEYFGLPMEKSKYYISSPYGYRTLKGISKHHNGVDLAASRGTPLYAVGDGKVITCVSKFSPDTGHYPFKGSSSIDSYGNYVIIDHGNIDGQRYYSVYCHLNAVSVKQGQEVKGSAKGQKATQVGILGHTGASTGPHLHFEIRVGSPKYGYSKNPLNYITLG